MRQQVTIEEYTREHHTLDLFCDQQERQISTLSADVATMPYAFDKCPERPANIEQILNGLDRYNPETTTVFQEYVQQQCEEKFFDCYACLALLKLYVYHNSVLGEDARKRMQESLFLPRFLLPDHTLEIEY